MKRNFLVKIEMMMYNLFKNNSLEKLLALIALLFGLFAALVGNPNKITLESSPQIEEVELKKDSVHLVDVRELAEWIMTKKNDFVLLDIRVKKRFEEYHIPYAMNILYDSLVYNRFESEKKVIYYWQNEKFPLQTWSALKDSAVNDIYILKGGMNEWITRILFPDRSEIEAMNSENIDKVIKTSKYFGGKPKLKNKNKKKSSKRYLREGC